MTRDQMAALDSVAKNDEIVYALRCQILRDALTPWGEIDALIAAVIALSDDRRRLRALATKAVALQQPPLICVLCSDTDPATCPKRRGGD